MILDLLSLLDRRVLGSMIATVSLLGLLLAWLQSTTDAAAGATALLVPAAALGVVAIVVRPVLLIIGALVVGGALMVGGLLLGF